MINWAEPMVQYFEYYEVNPQTWTDQRVLTKVTKSTIRRDLYADTLGSASIDITENIKEGYVRIYLVVVQNGNTYKYPLGTFLVQTPFESFNGMSKRITMDGYTPLIELKEKKPPLGFYIPMNTMGAPTNVMQTIIKLTTEGCRAPVVGNTYSDNMFKEFIADPNETSFDFISALLATIQHEFSIDEMGRILFSKKQEISSLSPTWTFNDDNASILLPEIDVSNDLYGVPNVIEVSYSDGIMNYQSTVTNDDVNSPLSTINRGRQIIYRETNPDIIGNPTANKIDKYALRRLKELSNITYRITFSHGYCPVRIGDCVLINYNRAGLTNIKARIVSQNIQCDTGCTIASVATFVNNLWGGK